LDQPGTVASLKWKKAIIDGIRSSMADSGSLEEMGRYERINAADECKVV
jgi:hypothetical protein